MEGGCLVNGQSGNIFLETALKAHDLGLSVVPPEQDGTKRPHADIPDGLDENGRQKYTWKQYQTIPATRDHIIGWYQSGNRTGLGLACGGTKKIELFEFDDEATYHEFKRAAAELGLAELVQWIETGYSERTPCGGVHWFFYCDAVRGSGKLAERPIPTKEDPHKRKTLIETKGQGGYAVIAPSNGRVHETGGAYVLLNGGLETIRTIAPHERDLLDDLARSFDEIPEKPAKKSSPSFKATTSSSDQEGTRPGDDFNTRSDWSDILKPHGWVEVFTRANVTYWRRPGKDHGWSATTGHCKGLKVFSTSTPFSTKGTYTPFGAYTVLNHHGNFNTAAQTLAKTGFGTWIDENGEEHQNPRLKRANKRKRPASSNATTSASNSASVPITKRGRWVACLHNSILWLKGQSTIIRHDQFREVILVNDEPLTDEMVLSLTAAIEKDKRTKWNHQHVWSALIEIGSHNQFSSLTEWLDSLTWDKVKRLDDFFHHAYGCEQGDYSAACARVLFLSAVARAYEPGCQVDTMITLIGKQGIFKSTGMAALCHNPDWFTDDLGCDLHDRNSGHGLRAKWLVEFGEFSRINRSTLDFVKGFLARRFDRYRPPYGRAFRDFPRTCIFVGSTNDDHPLQDIENRRFMPIKCTAGKIDWIKTNRDQLWAEAVARYQTSEPWWISNTALAEKVTAEQENARAGDFWETVLSDNLGNQETITMGEAARVLKIDVDRVDKSAQTRIGLAMKKIGYVRDRATTSNDRSYKWTKKK
jgi:hypothetical protein